MATTPDNTARREADKAEKISYGAIALATLAVLMSLYSCIEAKKDDATTKRTTRTETSSAISQPTPTPTP